MSISHDITVTEDMQVHYLIYDRVMTENTESEIVKNVLVTSDNLSNRLYFNMWYTFDDRELENKDISIIWINAKGERGLSVCTDKLLIRAEHRLTFAWNVPLEATYVAGTLQFAIRIIQTDEHNSEYIWNSLPAEVTVMEGLITEDWEDIPDAETI